VVFGNVPGHEPRGPRAESGRSPDSSARHETWGRLAPFMALTSRRPGPESSIALTNKGKKQAIKRPFVDG